MSYEKLNYPYLSKLGIPVNSGECIDYVLFRDLREALNREGIAEKFDEFFGCQTMCGAGPYAHDCEAVLRRIYTGELTGTQALFD